MTPEEEKAEFNKLAPAAINEVAGLIDGNFTGFQKAREDYLGQLPVGDPRFFEPALRPADFLSEEGMKQRGLLDEKGEATKLGEDYLFMEDEGFMKDGQLTEKGKAFVADPVDLLPVNKVNDWTIFTNTFDIDKDTGLPSDPEVLSKFRQFQIRKKEGLDEVEGGNVFKQLGEGVLSLGRGLYDVSQPRIALDILTGKGYSPSNEATKIAALASGAVNVMSDTAVKSVRFVGIPLEKNQEQKDLNDFIVATRVEMNKIASQPEVLDAITGTSVMADAYTKTLETYKERFGEAGESKLQQDLIDIKTVGQVAGDPLNVPLAMATSGVGLLGKFAMASRVGKSVDIANKASTQIARLSAAAPKVAEELSKAKVLNQTLVKQLDDAVKVGDSATVAKLTPVVSDSAKVVDDLTRTATQMEEGLALNQSIRTKAITELTNKSKPLDLSRKATAATVKGVEVAAEKMGNAAAFANRALRAAERTIGFYGTGRIISTGLGIGTGPIGQTALGAYYTARIGLSAAPKVLYKTAKFANVVGDELVQMKNSSPFWRRVAANENVGGIGKAMATTLDYASPAARFGIGSIKQGAKLAPAVAVYEAINNAGLDDNAMKRVGANALVFGAFARVVGGGKQDLAKRQTGDLYNYRVKQKNLGEEKLAAFDSIPDQNLKQFVSTYDSAYPNTWDWQFTKEGNSSFDPSSKTITVNVNNPSGFIRALTAHETLHSLTFKHGMDDSIVAKMLGDETRPGLVRDINGNLDKDFRQFYEAYNERLDAQGLPRIGIEDAAVEFFTDNGTAAFFDDVVSGKLTKAAVKTPLRRRIEDIFDTVFAATPIVKDLHYKLGGATDVNGRLVMGSGLLADGMKELPEVKAMIRKMYRESAGLPKSPIRPDAMGDAPSSNPRHYKAAEIINKINKKNVKDGKPLIEGVMIPDKKGNGTGLLSEEHIQALEEAGVIKEGGAQELMLIQSAFDADKAALLDYTPIEQGRSVQTAGKTANKVKPIDFMVKNGRLYMVGMDIVQLGLNIQRLERKAATMGMSKADILTDIAEMAKLHKQGKSTDGYFRSVGGKNWQNRKNLINAVQGLNTKSQLLTNPAFDKYGMGKQTGTYRTFAYDRVDGFTDLTGDMVIPYGNNAYYTLKANLMPQAPRINVKGEIVKDVPNARLMPNVAVVPERFTGSSSDIGRRGRYVEPPDFFRKFDITSYEKGGRFFDADNGQDLTGKKYATGSIDVSTGRPKLFVDETNKNVVSGAKFKTNLFKQSAGWKWTSENPPSTTTIVSVEGQGKHIYSLKTNFESGVELVRYSEKASEPRLRPTAYGEVKLGEKVGEISIRGRSHPVYDSVGIVPKEKNKVRYMPENVDADYMKAVKDGDMEMQQKLVDETAKKAGYDVGPVWHGSNAEFNKFDPIKTEDPNGFWFSTNRDWASRHGITRQYYLKNPKYFGGEDYVIPTSQTNNIKSADPITYDTNGNVIPISKRFDKTSSDIRFLPQGKSKAKPTSSPQKNIPKGRNLDNSVATGIAAALSSSGEKRNER